MKNIESKNNNIWLIVGVMIVVGLAAGVIGANVNSTISGNSIFTPNANLVDNCYDAKTEILGTSAYQWGEATCSNTAQDVILYDRVMCESQSYIPLKISEESFEVNHLPYKIRYNCINSATGTYYPPKEIKAKCCAPGRKLTGGETQPPTAGAGGGGINKGSYTGYIKDNEEQNVVLNGRTYNVKLTYLDANGAKFSVNGESTGYMSLESNPAIVTYTFSKGNQISLGSIFYPEGGNKVQYILGTQEVAINCKDSDGGVNYNVAGLLMSDSGMEQDYCINEAKLIEYFCYAGGTSANYEYYCPNGCKDGACVTTTSTGTCRSNAECQSGYVCSSTTNTCVINEVKPCTPNCNAATKACGSDDGCGGKCTTGYCGSKTQTCKDGACITTPVTPISTTCTDTDNGVIYTVKGTAKDSARTISDFCNDNYRLNEWYCGNDGVIKLNEHDCSADGKRCYNGVCR